MYICLSIIVSLFWVGHNGDGYKKAHALMIDVYVGINVTIIVKLIQIKIDMSDVIKLCRSKIKL